MQTTITRYRSVFISDTHLGTRGCRAEMLLAFLKSFESEYLYLVGDIVDGWRLSQSWYWPQSHSDVLQEFLRKPRQGTSVFYIPGNHDEFARGFVGLNIGDIKVSMQVEHNCADGRKLLVLHGDEYDMIIRRYRFLGLLGTRALAWLHSLNRINTWVRRQLGLRTWSLASQVKDLSKASSLVLSRFEHLIVKDTGARGYDGLICGHTHKPCVKQLGKFTYYNDGDWVDNRVALVEHLDGRFELMSFAAG